LPIIQGWIRRQTVARVTKGWARLFVVTSVIWFLSIVAIATDEYLSIKPPKYDPSAVIRVPTPDGKYAEFPASMSDEEISRVINQHFVPPKSPQSSTLPAYLDPTPLREPSTLPAWVDPTPLPKLKANTPELPPGFIPFEEYQSTLSKKEHQTGRLESQLTRTLLILFGPILFGPIALLWVSGWTIAWIWEGFKLAGRSAGCGR
jgi:hypothetical protein